MEARIQAAPPRRRLRKEGTVSLPLRTFANPDALGELAVSADIFDRDYAEALIHQIVVAYQAGGRAGTKAQKTRAMVKGGGAKPWKQKGTGRARAGTSRSPLWRGGGKVFAATPRDFSQKVNKKMYRAAMSSILAQLRREDRLFAIDEFRLDEPRTKFMMATLNRFGLEGNKTLVVSECLDEPTFLAGRNISWLGMCDVHGMDPVSLIDSDCVILARDAITEIEEWLAC